MALDPILLVKLEELKAPGSDRSYFTPQQLGQIQAMAKDLGQRINDLHALGSNLQLCPALIADERTLAKLRSDFPPLDELLKRVEQNAGSRQYGAIRPDDTRGEGRGR